MPHRKIYIVFPLALLWIIAIVLMSGLGYGNDDAWFTFRAAHLSEQYGKYVNSRPYGPPLFDLINYPIVRQFGYVGSNALSTAIGLSALVALYLIVKDKATRHPFWVFGVIAFAPGMLTLFSSTNDYIPAVATALWTLVLLRVRNVRLSWLAIALLIGVSTGFRMTNIALVVPAAAWMIWNKEYRQALFTIIVAVGVGFAAMWPLISLDGFDRGQLIEQWRFWGFTYWLQIMGYRTVALTGVFTTVFSLGAFIWIARNRRSEIETDIKSRNLEPMFHATLALTFFGIFFINPEDAFYLIITFPSLVLLFDRYLTRRLFLTFVVLVLSYHVFNIETKSGNAGDRQLGLRPDLGWTYRDIQSRQYNNRIQEAPAGFLVDEPTIMMADVWVPFPSSNWIGSSEGNFRCQLEPGTLCIAGKSPSEQELRSWSELGYRLVSPSHFRGLLERNSGEWQNYIELIEVNEFFGRNMGRPVQQ